VTTTQSDNAASGPSPTLSADAFTTASKLTRVFGIAAIVLTIALLVFALIVSPPEVQQADSVRLFYIHVPSAIVSLYLAFSITLVGSIMYLWKQSIFWDLMAGAAAEIGVLFCAITLVTGMLWGKPTWGVYWQWDPRLTSTTVSFLLYIGYLAVRKLELPPEVRRRRAAILGIISFANLIIVRYSVEWWRSLHQGTTLDPIDTQLDDTMLFSFLLGVLAMIAIGGWLLIHRFRVAWMEEKKAERSLASALIERRAEGL
jgi:heme exporter protein C